MENTYNLHLLDHPVGLVHSLLALSAMFFGALVLWKAKGTSLHKRWGYAYVAAMLLMNFSGFGMYHRGAFSVFHLLALVSLATVIAGIVPAWKKKHAGWRRLHYYFMTWSVVGLYAGFWSELGSRVLDMRYFWWAVLLCSLLTFAIGGYLITSKAKTFV